MSHKLSIQNGLTNEKQFNLLNISPTFDRDACNPNQCGPNSICEHDEFGNEYNKKVRVYCLRDKQIYKKPPNCQTDVNLMIIGHEITFNNWLQTKDIERQRNSNKRYSEIA